MNNIIPFNKADFSAKQKTLFECIEKLKQSATHSEICLMKKLNDINVKYIFQKGFINGNYYCIVDFYLPKPLKICIEVDGGYHSTTDQQQKDKRKDTYLKLRGFKIIRLKNENAESISLIELNQLLSN